MEAHTRAEKVRVLYRHGPPAQVLSIIASAVICLVLWEHTGHRLLLIWWGTITALTLGRIILAMRFAQLEPTPAQMPAWEKAFVLSLGVVALGWGGGGWLIMPSDSPLHQALVYFFLMGVAGASVAAYGSHAGASMVAVCALMLPATIGLALHGSLELRLMAAGGVLYLAAAVRSTRSFSFFLFRTFQLSFELREAYARAREQARTDELTGLANRRAFMELGMAAVDQANRYERPLSLLMMDIDHFKRINDTHGHAAGDQALRAVAKELRYVARAADTPGRLGGEEFALLLPETSATDAMAVAERLRRGVAALVIHHGGKPLVLTCSIGVAEEGPATNDIDALIRAADRALYVAKEGGRDRVEQDAGSG